MHAAPCEADAHRWRLSIGARLHPIAPDPIAPDPIVVEVDMPVDVAVGEARSSTPSQGKIVAEQVEHEAVLVGPLVSPSRFAGREDLCAALASPARVAALRRAKALVEIRMVLDRDAWVAQPAVRQAGAQGSVAHSRRIRSRSSTAARLLFSRKVVPQAGHLQNSSCTPPGTAP